MGKVSLCGGREKGGSHKEGLGSRTKTPPFGISKRRDHSKALWSAI